MSYDSLVLNVIESDLCVLNLNFWNISIDCCLFFGIVIEELRVFDNTVSEFRIIHSLKQFSLKNYWVSTISIIFKQLFINSLYIYIPSFWFMHSKNINKKDFINKVAQGIVLIHLEVTFKKFNLFTRIRKKVGLVKNAIFYNEFPDISQKEYRSLSCIDIGKIWVWN